MIDPHHTLRSWYVRTSLETFLLLEKLSKIEQTITQITGTVSLNQSNNFSLFVISPAKRKGKAKEKATEKAKRKG